MSKETRASFKPFSLTLSNSAVITGISCCPSISGDSHVSVTSAKPLLVGVHGGTCSAEHYHIDEKHTALNGSNKFGIPFVAFNRPGYLDSTSFLPLKGGEQHQLVEGTWFHQYIFPAIWKEFGLPNGCTSMVLTCHSLAVPPAIIATVLNAAQPDYPLAGLVFSGWGAETSIHPFGTPKMVPSQSKPGHLVFSEEAKNTAMVGSAQQGSYDSAVLKHTNRLNTSFAIEEIVHINRDQGGWWSYWESEYAKKLVLPVMYACGSNDYLWNGSKQAIDKFVAAFSNNQHVTGRSIEGAPHALESSKWSVGWYGMCFAFAVEASETYAWKESRGNTLDVE